VSRRDTIVPWFTTFAAMGGKIQTHPNYGSIRAADKMGSLPYLE
jgi:hypothetical protein